MQASWVRDSTATTGTGTMTLDGTPASGYLGFDDVFATGDVVHYTIEDANNNRETGIGTLTSGASWTLSRDQILETLSGTTYSQWPATGISLSGSATVGIAPTASGIIDPVKTYLSGSARDFGDHWAKDTTSGQTAVLTADRCYFIPIKFERPRKITTLYVNVTTIDAGATLSKVGIYTINGDGTPGRLIESVSFDASASTGEKTCTLTTPVVLNPGFYCLAVASDATPTLRAAPSNVMGMTFGYSIATYTPNYGYETLSGWSDLPSSPSLTGTSSGTMPLVWFT